jgi:hypothetical protein
MGDEILGIIQDEIVADRLFAEVVAAAEVEFAELFVVFGANLHGESRTLKRGRKKGTYRRCVLALAGSGLLCYETLAVKSK